MNYQESTSANEKIIERIRALIRLARGGVNHNECLVALNTAKQLIAQHKLDLKMFGFKVPSGQPEAKATRSGDRRAD